MEPKQKLPHANCSQCPLQGANGVAVPCAGPRDAAIAFVGEQPGWAEHHRGVPFVGPSGSLIREPLDQMGVKISEGCFWDNVVACYPKRRMNSTMYHDAAACCWPRLESEIFSLRPDVHIAALGKQAEAAFKFSTMYRWEQQEHFEDRWAMAFIHPAAILRDPKPRTTTDFIKGLKKLLKGVVTFPEAPVAWVVNRPEDLPDVHSPFFGTGNLPDNPIIVDLETSQVSWRDDAILLVGIGVPAVPGEDPRVVGTKALVLTPWAMFGNQGREWLELFFRVHGHRVGGHNFKFDAEFLNHQKGVPPEYCKTMWDTILMAHAHNENWVSDLKSLATYYFDAPPYEQEVFKYLKKKSDRWTAVPEVKLIEYLTKDLHYNLMLYFSLREELERTRQWDTIYKNVYIPVSQELTRHELRGVAVNRDRTNDEIKAFKAEEAALAEELREMSNGYIRNPNSTKDCSAFVYDVLKAPPCKVYGLTPRSTAKAALEEIKHLHPSLEKLRHYRRVSKLRTSYLENILKYARLDETTGMWRTHSNFLQYSVVHGRLSAREPAIQTIPRQWDEEDGQYGTRIKMCFVPTEGWTLIAVDGSQWEMRVGACESGDAYLIEQYNMGVDMHTAITNIFFPNGWTKEDRANVKRFDFSYMYGGSEESSATVFEIPKEQRAILIANLNRDMAGFVQWRKDQFRTACQTGVLRSRQGRTFHFPLILDKNYDDIRKATVNYTISGPASDLVCAAAAVVGPLLRNMGVWPLFTVHDSLIMEAPEGLELEAARLTAKAIEEYASKVYPEIPWVAEAEMSRDSWGRMIEVDLETGEWKT